MSLSIHDRFTPDTVEAAPDTNSALETVIRALRAAVPTLPPPVMINKVEHVAVASWGMNVAFLLECSVSGYIDYSASASGVLIKTVKWRIEDGIPGEVIAHVIDALPAIIPQTEELALIINSKAMRIKLGADLDDGTLPITGAPKPPPQDEEE